MHARGPSLSRMGAALRVLRHAGLGVRARAFTTGCVRTGASRHRCSLPGRRSLGAAQADACARAQVGAGVLGLPYAFKYLQWPGGMVTIILSYIISLYTLWQLCVLHEDRGKRFNRRAPPPGRACSAQATPAPPQVAPAALARYGGREGGSCWHPEVPGNQTGLLDNSEQQGCPWLSSSPGACSSHWVWRRHVLAGRNRRGHQVRFVHWRFRRVSVPGLRREHSARARQVPRAWQPRVRAAARLVDHHHPAAGGYGRPGHHVRPPACSGSWSVIVGRRCVFLGITRARPPACQAPWSVASGRPCFCLPAPGSESWLPGSGSGAASRELPAVRSRRAHGSTRGASVLLCDADLPRRAPPRPA